MVIWLVFPITLICSCSERGAWVDDKGVTLFEEEFLKSLELRNNAIPREDVEDYLTVISGQYKLDSELVIPEIFLSLDVDGDGNLSLDELLLVIDKYFDFQLNLEEVRQLNDFFFSQ